MINPSIWENFHVKCIPAFEVILFCMNLQLKFPLVQIDMTHRITESHIAFAWYVPNFMITIIFILLVGGERMNDVALSMTSDNTDMWITARCAPKRLTRCLI